MRRISLIVAAAAALLAVASGQLLESPSALAAEGDSEVTWSVSPSDEAGPDGRAWVELALDPGQTTTQYLAVRNLGDAPVTFALTAADGYFTPTGRFNMLASDQPSTAAGTWISIQDSVMVAAGEMAIVPFSVSVPADATPGDHAAGVAASITSESTGEGAKLGVESRVGFRVMTRVAGELNPSLDLAGEGEYHLSWNPFTPGRVTVTAELANTGNVRIAAAAELQTESGGRAADGLTAGQEIELLPGDHRRVQFSVPAVWPLGAISLPLRIEANTIEPDGTSTALAPVAQTITVWAFPLPQLMVGLALLLLVVGIVIGRRRQKNHVERRITEAREAGRREALDRDQKA